MFEDAGHERWTETDQHVWRPVLYDMISTCRRLPQANILPQLRRITSLHKSLMDDEAWTLVLNVQRSVGDEKAEHALWKLRKRWQIKISRETKDGRVRQQYK